MPKAPLFLVCTLLSVLSARAQSPSQAGSDAQAACRDDLQKFCSGVAPGGGRLLACLKQHKADVSSACRQAVVTAMQSPGASPAPASGAPRLPPASSAAAANPPAPKKEGQHNIGLDAGAARGTSGYLQMKRVDLIDQGLGQGRTAYHLLIPSTWRFKGWVNVGVAEGGCFADWFEALADAKSENDTVEFQMLPQFTWQYADDPGIQRQMQQRSQMDARSGMKPCPVRAPVSAEKFLRDDLLAKTRKGKTIVAIEPFPELEQITRHRLGLRPQGRPARRRGCVPMPPAHGSPTTMTTDDPSRNGSPPSSSSTCCPMGGAARSTTGMRPACSSCAHRRGSSTPTTGCSS